MFIYFCGKLIHLERCLCLRSLLKSYVCLLIALDLYASPTGEEKRCLLWKWDFLQLCLVLLIAVFLGHALCALVGVDGLLVRCPSRVSILWLVRCCLFANTRFQFFLAIINVQKLDIGIFNLNSPWWRSSITVICYKHVGIILRNYCDFYGRSWKKR